MTCDWNQDLRQAGVRVPLLATTFTIGIPAVALTLLTAVAVAAALSEAWVGIGILAVAALPWVRWVLVGDDGPTWTFGVFALVPLAVLGFCQWYAPEVGLRSEVAYVLLALPVLLLFVLVAWFAPVRYAVGLGAGGYLAYGAPLMTAAPLLAVVLWHVGVALAVAAGYAVRLSQTVNAKVSEARVAEERRQVARDVHDVVAHTLAITMLHITAARMAVRRSSPVEAEEALTEAERHGRASLADIRRIVRLLRADESPIDPAPPGLADVEALAASYRAAGLPVRLSLTVPEDAGSAAQLAVYRVLQEALANAARHGSGPATVDLAVSGGTVTLTVGNPVSDGVERGTGSGLLGMRERISVAGGTVDAGVRDGSWVVRAVVPA